MKALTLSIPDVTYTMLTKYLKTDAGILDAAAAGISKAAKAAKATADKAAADAAALHQEAGSTSITLG